MENLAYIISTSVQIYKVKKILHLSSILLKITILENMEVFAIV